MLNYVSNSLLIDISRVIRTTSHGFIFLANSEDTLRCLKIRFFPRDFAYENIQVHIRMP